ncbi:MAG: hypothetical protein Q7S45_00550 [Candidatus Curtissbacteria bacterium]|nr:hypothetical protein [Candidatus Curtissbacteria bacterium]
MGNRVYRKVLFWREALRLERYVVQVVAVDPMQVTNENGNAGAALVGGMVDGEIVRIYTTRRLKEDDIIHELLHFRYPQESEEEVRRMTEEMLISRNSIYMGSGMKERF